MDAIYELAPAQLRRSFDPHTIVRETGESAEIPAPAGIIGQQRAIAALELGLGIQNSGYNIYVSGPPGIGKMTAVQAFLEKHSRARPAPSDWCYVNSFADPSRPIVLRLPAGHGRRLQEDLQQTIAQVRRDVPKAFESESYVSQRDEVNKSLLLQRDELLAQLNERALHDECTIKLSPAGILVIPSIDGHPMTDSDFEALSVEQRDTMLAHREAVQEALQEMLKQGRLLERAAQERLRILDQQVVLSVVGVLLDELKARYPAEPEVIGHLSAVQQDILEHSDLFRGARAGEGAPEGVAAVPWAQELPFRKYQVNLLVDNSRQSGAPVVVEFNPSYPNLFGRIEKESMFGALSTDFTQIKAGALHQANGGFLVMSADDLLRNPISWDALKRCLRSQSIEIEDIGERLGLLTTKGLRPQAIPLDVKLVLVGPPLLYALLSAYDESFPELFKVRADFDTRMPSTPENIQAVSAFMSGFCQKERLLPLDSGAVAEMLASMVRLAEDQEKLSAHLGTLVDLIREAHYWASQVGGAAITAAHVRQALDAKIFRSNLLQEQTQEAITSGALLITTRGAAVGQVNGLSVVRVGEYEFGRPSRISASAGPGRGEIVDIEREVALGGPIHSKGILILSGYLSHMYARDKPLSLGARLVFEQSYSGVEGDSASSAELYALLSALSGLPIAQRIAVTGSVSQHGEVQAIGGVNEKIEGFFDICRADGLTGDQGVMIPQSNMRNLMLREDVVAAVRDGQFHIWAIATIDAGITQLTGVPAGERQPDGRFPEGTVHAAVDQRLCAFLACLRASGAAAQAQHDGALALQR